MQPLRVPDCLLAEFMTEEMMPYHFVLQRCEGVPDVIDVAHMQQIPVYRVGTSVTAFPAFPVGHFLELLEATQVVRRPPTGA